MFCCAIYGVILSTLITAPLFGQAAATTVYETTACPVPDFVKPYTIIARYDPARSRDSAYFRQLANHTGGYLRAIPRVERHVTVAAVLRHDGSLKSSRVASPSGDRDFDRLALRAVRDAVASRTLGPLPPDVQGDTLSVAFLFGETPDPQDYAVRSFSRQSRLPQLLSDSVVLSYVTGDSAVARRKGKATLSAMIDTTGSAEAGARVLKASGESLGLAARQLITSLTFAPGQSDCAPQRYEVWVRFTFSGHGVAYAQLER
jgi:TonB family protein